MYTKQDAKMTQGLAILSMLVLHLFCRLGTDVYGTPLIWLNDKVPLVYLFGFFAEICVPLYSLAAGFAQEHLFEQGQSTLKARLKRILKLMKTYWVVVALFSIIGLIKQDPLMPGSLTDFLKALVLIHSYNGAWWFLHSYIILLLIPPVILLYPVKHLDLKWGGALCTFATILWYLLGRFGLRLSKYCEQEWLHFILIEMENLIGILPPVWFGGLMCRYRLFDDIEECLVKKVPDEKKQKWLFLSVIIILFIGFYVIHKAVLASFNAVAVFLIFNLWKKDSVIERAMLFLGKHSTNIWLTHMFFYLFLFPGLVQRLKLPILMLSGLLALSLISSMVINYAIQMYDLFIERI